MLKRKPKVLTPEQMQKVRNISVTILFHTTIGTRPMQKEISMWNLMKYRKMLKI